MKKAFLGGEQYWLIRSSGIIVRGFVNPCCDRSWRLDEGLEDVRIRKGWPKFQQEVLGLCRSSRVRSTFPRGSGVDTYLSTALEKSLEATIGHPHVAGNSCVVQSSLTLCRRVLRHTA